MPQLLLAVVHVTKVHMHMCACATDLFTIHFTQLCRYITVEQHSTPTVLRTPTILDSPPDRRVVCFCYTHRRSASRGPPVQPPPAAFSPVSSKILSNT